MDMEARNQYLKVLPQRDFMVKSKILESYARTPDKTKNM